MRIISDFHDYYDGVMKSGMDSEVVYVREKIEILIKPTFEVGHPHERPTERFYNRYHLLGYVGQVYHVIETVDSGLGTSTFRIDFANNMLAEKPSKKDRWRWFFNEKRKFLEQDVSAALKIFHEHQVPIFLISAKLGNPKARRLVLNPCLKDLHFYSIKDSYTAYQDIFQYISGVLNGPENKMVEISDKDKVSKHGFDKWSFRQKGPKK